MGRIVVMNHVTLDGVMQGPGRPDEDTRGGFTQGGWGQRSTEPGDAAGRAMGERMAAGGGLAGWLFGRWTYDQLLSHWNSQPDSPFAPHAQRHAQVCRFDFTQRTTPLAQLDVAAWRHPQSGWHPQGSVQRGSGDHGQWSADQFPDAPTWSTSTC